MKGKHHISVQDKRVRYDFDIKRNITIIRGDSATGKTTLIEMLSSYSRLGKSSGVTVSADCKLIVLDGQEWEYRIERNPGAIFFIDEDNHFVVTEEFAAAVKNADNYFVIVTRDNLPNLSYSVEEIYGIRNSGRYGGLKQIYHEFYQLYGDYKNLPDDPIDLCIVEDSNSGYDFYRAVCKLPEKKISSANGKSNIRKKLISSESVMPLVIADGAAFGPEMDHIDAVRLGGQKVVLYLPESFEWMILASGIIEDKEINEILQRPEAYIDSLEYVSWERFFTALLIERSRGSYLQYQKGRLNQSYLQDKIVNRILCVLPENLQEWFHDAK